MNRKRPFALTAHSLIQSADSVHGEEKTAGCHGCCQPAMDGSVGRGRRPFFLPSTLDLKEVGEAPCICTHVRNMTRMKFVIADRLLKGKHYCAFLANGEF